MKKIVIASDSFKGSLSSQEVADAFEKGVRDIIEECNIVKVPIADGGEGSVDALTISLKGEYVYVEVNDPLSRRIKTKYGFIESKKTAIIEASAACGLTLLNENERNPMKTTTFGVGEIIKDAINRGSKKLIIGIGGTSTNDAGTGMLQALGYNFYNTKGELLNGNGENLCNISYLSDNKSNKPLKEIEILVACDVTNPLYGENGAAYIYAPQKGADKEMIKTLDNGLRNFATIVNKYNKSDYSFIPGTGAAGGLGFALKSLLNAKLVRGIDIILELIDFGSIIKDSDIIVTGEGKIDSQTLMGKTPSGILNYGLRSNIPVIAICGKIDWSDNLKKSNFKEIIQINPNTISLTEAMNPTTAKNNIRLVAQEITKKYITEE